MAAAPGLRGRHRGAMRRTPGTEVRGRALVLVGGYTEERLVDGQLVRRRLYPGRLNIIRHSDYHSVVELHGRETWTLFLMGRRVSSWGFWVDRKHVEWRERLRERGLTPDY